MADNVGNADARPDLELEGEFGDDRPTIDEQELADAMAPCGAEGVGIALGHPGSDAGDPSLAGPGSPVAPSSLSSGATRPAEASSGAPVQPGHPGPGSGHPAPSGHPAGIPMDRQRHGGARSVGFRPGGGPAALAYEERTGIKAPRIIAWEITRSCNLSCAHCRAAAEFGHYHGELSLGKIKEVIDDIVTISNPIIILTGGEPLMRPDIWEIIDYCHEKGAMPVIGTNATLITEDIAAKMAEHKIPRISVSIDFPTAEGHDSFRGQPGCFDQSIEGIKIAKRHGVGVQINTTVTTLNAHLIDEIHDLAESLGVDAFHIFMLVPTGRGSDMLDKELPPEEYERVLTWAYHRQKTSPLHFKPTDSPHYYRIIRQLAKAEGKKVTREEYGLDAMTRGCLGGITFCFVSHTGDIQPCGYFDMQLGNVKDQPFSQIWTESKVFNELRDYSLLKGKCGACEYKAVCGGC
ncbi:MAG TPA: radical SAM protein, partial [Coriobacteriia bacterium]|nr:radical SAM protein [Coriobacteriia bacterium]